ncbi:hypothetical protein BDY17DRAFT_290878 [Neohortaea acidophila]|uniref:Uncharacterized protein n=1 Tax=Neohortaea acidophila TaxID=245834 RepID=A0A6A6Q1I7_9PEZI|nr:uncharacterized protein BDY17DRAFT_290878 [Neohortaea acidophila]KAF2486125.1 hypothetical protein BDY17DRAFT_290878 [Neohortaea acidophila]
MHQGPNGKVRYSWHARPRARPTPAIHSTCGTRSSRTPLIFMHAHTNREDARAHRRRGHPPYVQ